MKLFFIDTETGGLNPSQHSLLTIGYIIYDDEKREIIEGGIIYHKANEYTVTPSALRINQLNLVEVYEKGLTKEEIIQKFKELKEKYCQEDKFLLAGWNLQFDINFLKTLLGEVYKDIFYYKGIDIFTLYYLAYKEHVSLKDAAIKILGEDVKGRQWHNALTDTIVTVEIFEKLYKILRRYK